VLVEKRMICPQCKNQNDDNQAYCENCGTQLKQPNISPENNNQRKSYLKDIIAIFLIIFVIWLVAGQQSIILSLLGSPFGQPSAHIGEMSVTSNIWDGTTTFNIQVYNSGNAVAKNVYVDLTVYNSDKSKTLASKNLFVGNIEPGQTRTATSTIYISESKYVYTASGYIDNPANRFGK